MKIAVLADVHSRFERPQAVQRAIAGHDCEETRCLGDLVEGGSSPVTDDGISHTYMHLQSPSP